MTPSNSEKGLNKMAVSRAKVITSQVVATLALDLLLVDLGMAISFVTMVLPEVLDAKEGLSINEYQASWFGSMAFLCQPVGSIFSGPILDYFGRKKAIIIVNVPHLVAWLMMYYSWNVPALFLANALLGIGTGIMEAPSVTYVGEISDSSIRGILTTMCNAFTSIGMFLAHLLGTILPWRQAALVSLLVPLSSMFLTLLIPETPIWLLSKGRQKEALQSLCTLRGWAKPEDVKEEFDQLIEYNEMLQQCVICAKTGNTPQMPCEHTHYNMVKKICMKMKHVLFARETIRPFMLVMAYFIFHTMSGMWAVRPNMVNVCRALGMIYDPKTIVVIVGAVFIVCNLSAALFIKLMGKRKLVLCSLLGTALCSLSLSLYARSRVGPEVFSYEPSTFPEPTEMLPVVLFLLLVCFTSMGIPWVLLSEMFPFRSRATATSLAAAAAYITFFFAGKTNYNIEANFHLSGAFAIYAAFGLVGTVYLYFCLPETENKTLVEIEQFYRGNQKIFADDFLINKFRNKRRSNNEANKPMLVN